MRQRTACQKATMAKMGTLSYCIYLKNVKEIVENTSEYQFEEKEAVGKNDSGTDEFDSSSDGKSLAMADEIDDSAVFLVERTARFGRVNKLSNKLLS